ncbi:LPXTG cell wall anchor domain-containing protein [Ligilactobacillus salivarius]|uniref:LPXTG cell wall anchor domain-containing protein n=2 Tax=Ligilactobacillus salivarius TaxID=1624 RepID=UPI0022E94783|nr:LPXTG cell wall anchor domain-containing protein [Ligilactobacillus salivarius]
MPEASSTTNYDVDNIYNYYVSKGGTASKQKVQDLIDYKNNSSRVTAILNLTVDSYWVDQVLNKEVPNAQKFTDSFIDRIITTSGNSLVTTTNSKIDDQIAKLTELQQKYPNSKEVENAIEKLNETKNSVTLENVYNAKKMQDVIDTLNKYGSVSAYDDLEKAAENEQTSGSGELDNAKTDAKAAIDKLENLNDAQKAGFIADVDAASLQQLVEQAVANAKALDSEMAKLRQEVESSNQVKDTTKYANSSDTLKKNYDDLLAVATALVSKNGIDANLATVQQLVSELKAARLALNGVDSKVETNNNTDVNKAKDSLSNKATASLKTTSLPQTGETEENTSLVGAMLATIGGVLGLGLTRRKKEDK